MNLTDAQNQLMDEALGSTPQPCLSDSANCWKALAGLAEALERKADNCKNKFWHTSLVDRAMLPAAEAAAFREAASMARQCLSNSD